MTRTSAAEQIVTERPVTPGEKLAVPDFEAVRHMPAADVTRLHLADDGATAFPFFSEVNKFFTVIEWLPPDWWIPVLICAVTLLHVLVIYVYSQRQTGRLVLGLVGALVLSSPYTLMMPLWVGLCYVVSGTLLMAPVVIIDILGNRS